ncbi:MAG: hypothetical protein V3W41_00250 [Planctomycetota bacterium]
MQRSRTALFVLIALAIVPVIFVACGSTKKRNPQPVYEDPGYEEPRPRGNRQPIPRQGPRNLRQRRLAELENLDRQGWLDRDTYELGAQLIGSRAKDLRPYDRDLRAVFVALTDGQLHPRDLTRELDRVDQAYRPRDRRPRVPVVDDPRPNRTHPNSNRNPNPNRGRPHARGPGAKKPKATRPPRGKPGRKPNAKQGRGQFIADLARLRQRGDITPEQFREGRELSLKTPASRTAQENRRYALYRAVAAGNLPPARLGGGNRPRPVDRSNPSGRRPPKQKPTARPKPQKNTPPRKPGVASLTPKQRVSQLDALYRDGSLKKKHYRHGRNLLARSEANMQLYERTLRAVYVDLAEGRLAPGDLVAAIDAALK